MGDPQNARLWQDADVFVSFDLDAEAPTDVDTEFGTEWDLVGLLDGEQGFVHGRSEDVADHFAWGGILMRTSRRNFKQTVTFRCFERNETTHRLMWPGSTGGQIKVPKPERVKVAFEVRDGDQVRRLISAYQAEIVVDGDVTDNEQDIAAVQFVATIYPDTDGVLWEEQPDSGS
jgi:hypothetical protein